MTQPAATTAALPYTQPLTPGQKRLAGLCAGGVIGFMTLVGPQIQPAIHKAVLAVPHRPQVTQPQRQTISFQR